MEFINLHPVNFLIISGILQGFILAGALFFKKTDHTLSNKLLALTILLVNLHLSYLMILDLNLDNRYPYLLWFPYSFLTAIGPLILLYTKSLLVTQFKIAQQEKMLFLPLAIELMMQLIQIAYSGSQDILYYNTPSDSIITIIIYLFSAASIFYYSKRSLRLITSHEQWVKRNFSNSTGITLSWLAQLLTYYRILWFLWIPFAVVFLIFFRLQMQNLPLILIIYILMLCISYLSYWIGLEGIRRMDTLFFHAKVNTSKESSTYDKIADHKIGHYINRLQEIMMKEKLYLNESLSRSDLSKHLEIDPNLLSYILNTHIEKSFYEFINSYRVEEVKHKLSQADYKHYTLLAIALDSGFNSKTSFNRVFKQMTGLTPRQYQKKIKAK